MVHWNKISLHCMHGLVPLGLESQALLIFIISAVNVYIVLSVP